MGVCLRVSMQSVADSASRSSRVGQILNSSALVATHGREERRQPPAVHGDGLERSLAGPQPSAGAANSKGLLRESTGCDLARFVSTALGFSRGSIPGAVGPDADDSPCNYADRRRPYAARG